MVLRGDKEVCRYLVPKIGDVAVRTIRAWRADGLPYRKFRNRVTVAIDELEEWISGHWGRA